MKVAIPIWDGRVSPVFDVAQELLVAKIESDRKLHRTQQRLPDTGLVERVDRVNELGIDVLICGAISHPLEEMLSAKGVRVIPWICGPVEAVLQAFISAEPIAARFSMPGCCARRGRGAGGGRRGRGAGGGRRGRGW